MSLDYRAGIRATEQFGLITWLQARALGFSESAIRYRVRTERWLVLEPGIYIVNGAPRSWEQAVMGAVLACDGLAAASYLTCAAAMGVIEARPYRHHVTVPHGWHIEPNERRIVHQARGFSESEIRFVNSLPVTRPERMLVDVAGLLEPSALAAAVDNTLTLRLTTINAALNYIDLGRFGRRRGAGRLKRILEDRRDGAPASVLERLFLEVIAVEPLLPKPHLQFQVAGSYIDAAYPSRRIAIELQSLTHHGTVSAQQRDLKRQNKLQLALRGWTFLQYNDADLKTRPREVVRELLDAYRSGSPTQEGGEPLR